MNPRAAPPCPSCGGKLLRIAYGMPGGEMMEAANRGEIILGGCIISEGDPDLECAACGEQFRALDAFVGGRRQEERRGWLRRRDSKTS